MSQHEIKTFFRRNSNPKSEIEYIGGENSNGTNWKLSIDRAIEGIEKGKWTFYICIQGQNLDVLIDDKRKTLVIDVRNTMHLDLTNFSL